MDVETARYCAEDWSCDDDDAEEYGADTCRVADESLLVENELRWGSGSRTNSLPSATTTRDGDGGLSDGDRSAYTVLCLPVSSALRCELLPAAQLDGSDCIVTSLLLWRHEGSFGQVSDAHRVCPEPLAKQRGGGCVDGV